MFLPFKNDIFSEIKALVFDEKVVVLNHMNLGWRFVPYLSAEWVDSIIVGVGVKEESNRLCDRKSKSKISLFCWFQFKHILMILMPIEAASADLKLPRIELILSLSKLLRLLVIDFLCHGEMLVFYHFLVLFLSFFLSFLHLLHCVLVCLFGLFFYFLHVYFDLFFWHVGHFVEVFAWIVVNCC